MHKVLCDTKYLFATRKTDARRANGAGAVIGFSERNSKTHTAEGFSMQRAYPAWYLLIPVMLLVLAGLRIAQWPAPRPQAIEAARAEAGQTLFRHVWVPQDPLAQGGDGLGPVFNAQSCMACHQQGGMGGSGGLEHNVTLFSLGSASGSTPREGVVHAHAVNALYQENLAQLRPGLPDTSRPNLEQLAKLNLEIPGDLHFSQRNTPALFGTKLIDEIPDRVIIANERKEQLRWAMAPPDVESTCVGRALRLLDGRVGRFGWKAQTASLAEFVQAACANELGLGNPGQAQPRPLGKSDYQPCGLDLTAEQCNELSAFVASLPRPVERLPNEAGALAQCRAGKQLFHSVGCAACHTPDLGSVDGLYSDLLLHRMGEPLAGGGSYNEPLSETQVSNRGASASPGEWRTPPLWGIADSAPYLHDGRATTLEDAIRLHGGQGARAAQRFARLYPFQRAQLIAFLKTLQAPE
jgi:CxxC motif-containing protein (DUF1111 family)